MLIRTSRLFPFIVAWICGAFPEGPSRSEELPSDRAPWERHLIDGSSRGADGVRLRDVNQDGLLDITTGWEEGGITRVYIHPGEDKAKSPWPAVTVGKTPSVEDAVFCDVDGDGAFDVVSSCEGRTRTVFVHWAPSPASYLEAEAWEQEAVPATMDRTAWMFALPMDIDGKNGIDIAVASKGQDALVGWLQSPPDSRALSDWRLHIVYKAGWIMSLISADVDQDGDLDLVVSDRKGPSPGVLWLENRDPAKTPEEWTEHRMGSSGREIMFMDLNDLDGDGRPEAIAAVKYGEIHFLRRPSDPTRLWTSQIVQVALPEGVGTAKGIRTGDVDGDGAVDLVYSCEHAIPPKRGVVWLGRQGGSQESPWRVHDISGPKGIKFDRIELVDLDGDHDLDVLTCEERHQMIGLGVIWYENPFNGPATSPAR